jgi:hypothetical protein
VISAALEFSDGAPFFELSDHFEQVGAVGFLEVEAAGNVVRGCGVSSNLQKTKDIVGTEMRGASHKLWPGGGIQRARRILLTFFCGTRNYFRGKGVT